jgi:hypothetical protein
MKSRLKCQEMPELLSTSLRSLSIEHHHPLNHFRPIMACPRCRLRLSLSQGRPNIRIPRRRAFHTSPSQQRQQLGAFTYPQEWQTGTYHFNKATQKTYPVAAQHTDRLLSQWLTQQKKRIVSDNAAYQLMLRGSIAAQRRKSDRIFISKSTVKDFGDRVEVNAFIYDGVEAAAKEEERKKKARMGVNPEGGEQGRRRRRPTRLRALSGSEGASGLPEARRSGGIRARTPGSPGFRRAVVGNVGPAGRGQGPPRGGVSGLARPTSGLVRRV